MIQQVGYNINSHNNISFKGKGLNLATNFDGKYLKDLDGEPVSGYFIKTLKSGKNFFAEYKNGLLRKAGVSSNGKTNIRNYSYNADGKLIKVEKNEEDVFIKDCGYIDSDIISYYETINHGKIELGYNSNNQKIAAIIKPKLLHSIFTYVGNSVQEMRYKITNAETDGYNFWVRRTPGKQNDDNIIDTDLLKKIVKNKQTGNITITSIKMKNTTELVEKDKNGKVLSVVRTAFNKDAKPVWIRETDGEENLLFERKVSYNQNGNIKTDMIYDAKSLELPYYKEITYNANEQIAKEKLYNEEKILQVIHENTYNDAGKLVKAEIYNPKGKILEREVFKYNKDADLIFSHYIGTDKEDLLEGYYKYENNKIKYELEKYDESIEESFYDENNNLEKFIIKDTNNIVQKSYIHTHKNNVLTNTVCKDGEGNIFCTIEHEITKLPDKKIHTKIFRDKNNNFIVREQITYTDEDELYAYFDKNGKSVPSFYYLKYLNY